MKLSYLDNMDKVLKEHNQKAYEYGDGLAWDNKKHKTWRLQTPRGSVYLRLEKMLWKSEFVKLSTLIKKLNTYGYMETNNGT